MAVLMEVFAWGGRIAARVLRGAADVVDGLVGLLDAGVPAGGASPDPWGSPDEQADPFERFRANAAAHDIADSLSGDGGFAAGGDGQRHRSARGADEDTSERADDRIGEDDEDETETVRTAFGDLRDGAETEADVSSSSGDDGLEESESDEDEDDAAEDDEEGDVAAEAGTESPVEASGVAGSTGAVDGFDPSASEPAPAESSGLDGANPLADLLDRLRTRSTALQAEEEEETPSAPADASSSSFGDAFRSRGTLAPAGGSDRPPRFEDEGAPRPGTRERIAAALGAARSTMESARARRALGSSTSRIEQALREGSPPRDPLAPARRAEPSSEERAGRRPKRDDDTRRKDAKKKSKKARGKSAQAKATRARVPAKTRKSSGEAVAARSAAKIAKTGKNARKGKADGPRKADARRKKGGAAKKR